MEFITLFSFTPEIYLSASILIFLLHNIININISKFNFPVLKFEIFSQVITILICLFILLLCVKIEGNIYNASFVSDSTTINLKIVWLVFCIFSFLIIWRSFLLQKLNFFEFFVIFLLSIFASLLLLSSVDLLAVYLIIELQSICFYILSSFRRSSSFSSEAGLKYFISSAFMSCVFLLGASILYASLGTLNFNAISLLLVFGATEYSYTIFNFIFLSSLFIVVFFLFKLSIAPYHFWFPQIYDGAPLSSTIYFSILPKFVIFSVLIRWLSTLSIIATSLTPIILISAAFSSFFGVFLALKQKKLKKFLIYSSIGQFGLPVSLVGLLDYNSIVYSYFFLFIYMFTSVLVWGYFFVVFSSSLISSKTKGSSVESPLFLTSLSNMFKYNMIWSFLLLIVFFSMCGIPPLSGFFAKMWVYSSLLDFNYFAISVFLILVGAFSAFYYIKIIKITFFEKTLVDSLTTNHSLYRLPFFFVDCSLYAFLLFFLFFFFFYTDLLLFVTKGFCNFSYLPYANL
jgi:proton-translocating NADH-quinone oxidoreductase chain N